MASHSPRPAAPSTRAKTMSLVRDSTPPPSLVTVETATQSSSIPQKRCSPSAECADAHTALGGEVPDDALGARVEPGRDDDELVRVVALVRQRHVEALLKGCLLYTSPSPRD